MTKILSLFVLFFAFQVKASILIEPLVGYQLASKMDVDGGDSYSGGRGAAFGGRLGYQNLGFQIGLDYLNSNLDFDDKDFKEVKSSEWGAFVGFEFPILLRVYAGYIFSATANTKAFEDTTSQYYKTDFENGSGMKAGVGFTLLPFLDINLEYRRVSYDEWKIKDLGAKFDDKITMNAYMLSVSLPFNI